jgi:hypothetical protein
MSGWSYAVQGAIVLVLACLFAAAYRETQNANHENTKERKHEKESERESQRTMRLTTSVGELKLIRRPTRS